VETIAGEENLLALFLSKYVRTGYWHEQIEQAQNGAKLFINGATWDQFIKTDLYQQAEDIARDSRVWDRIIRQFAVHAFAGTLAPGSPETVSANEEMLRAMAQEPRIARLFLAAHMVDRWSHHVADRVDYRIVASPTHADTLYVFVFVPNAFETAAEYREVRQDYLRNYCILVASKHRTFRRILGIATDAGHEPHRTFDILSFEASRWTPEAELLVHEIESELGVTGEGTIHTLTPDDPVALMKMRTKKPARQKQRPTSGKIGRNDPCPCKSGKKFKNCCLRRPG
jgi:hypothetical protein